MENEKKFLRILQTTKRIKWKQTPELSDERAYAFPLMSLVEVINLELIEGANYSHKTEWNWSEQHTSMLRKTHIYRWPSPPSLCPSTPQRKAMKYRQDGCLGRNAKMSWAERYSNGDGLNCPPYCIYLPS